VPVDLRKWIDAPGISRTPSALLPGNGPPSGVNVTIPVPPSVLLRGGILLGAMVSLAYLLFGLHG
jgi:hypothetical protein